MNIFEHAQASDWRARFSKRLNPFGVNQEGWLRKVCVIKIDMYKILYEAFLPSLHVHIDMNDLKSWLESFDKVIKIRYQLPEMIFIFNRCRKKLTFLAKQWKLYYFHMWSNRKITIIFYFITLALIIIISANY